MNETIKTTANVHETQKRLVGAFGSPRPRPASGQGRPGPSRFTSSTGK